MSDRPSDRPIRATKWGVFVPYDEIENPSPSVVFVIPCTNCGNIANGHKRSRDCWCEPTPVPGEHRVWEHHDPTAPGAKPYHKESPK